MSLAALWVIIRSAVEQFVLWSDLVINATLIWTGIQGVVGKWRELPTDLLVDRLVDNARTSFIVFAILGFVILYVTSPKPLPAKPINCAGLTLGVVDTTGKLSGRIVSGGWQFDPNKGQIIGTNGKRYQNGSMMVDWCFALPRR